MFFEVGVSCRKGALELALQVIYARGTNSIVGKKPVDRKKGHGLKMLYDKIVCELTGTQHEGCLGKGVPGGVALRGF